MKISGLWKNVKQIWKPTAPENRTNELDETINEFAPYRIRKSPAMEDLSISFLKKNQK